MTASSAIARSFVIVRTFNARCEMVWKAWTDRAAWSQWWQPMGTPIVVKTYDVKRGGVFHYGMNLPDGGKWWGRFAYREVEAPSRLLYVNSFSDERVGITRAPFNPNWPLEIFTNVRRRRRRNLGETRRDSAQRNRPGAGSFRRRARPDATGLWWNFRSARSLSRVALIFGSNADVMISMLAAI